MEREKEKRSADRGRWSSRRKLEVVLRILRGEDLDTLSRELGVTAARLAEWRDTFLAAGKAGLKSRRSDHRDEEIARLDAHLQQVRHICETQRQAGRRLDFLSQEMLREANTVASKASDAEIARRVVDIKCLIERLKEQVQNVE